MSERSEAKRRGAAATGDDSGSGALWLFAILAGLALALFALAWIVSVPPGQLLRSPGAWLARLDPDSASGALETAAEVTAGVLAIAMTVVAIVVELAATRYSHRITFLFIRNRANAAVLGLFVLTTVQCLWMAISVLPSARGEGEFPAAGFAVTMLLVSISLLILLPYFAHVFSFISPLNIVRRIQRLGSRTIESASAAGIDPARRHVLQTIDELQDVARGAVEQGDRSIAMACVDALYHLVSDYQGLRPKLPAGWNDAEALIAEDPDFVSLAPPAMAEALPIWVEVKVFRQYLSLMRQATPRARDVANVIAIRTRLVASDAVGENEALLRLCIRCFNSYLRAALNERDLRTAYYVMNEYRLLAEELLRRGRAELASEITGYFQFYGLLSHRADLSFLLEVAAHDIVQICRAAHGCALDEASRMISLLLDLDQEIKEESNEPSLLGVRRAQIQLAAFLMDRGDEASARRICSDLLAEDPVRLHRVFQQLRFETDSSYHEFTDRGVNFAWLEPELRQFLPGLERWATAPSIEPEDAR